jgi:hypothetical protein
MQFSKKVRQDWAPILFFGVVVAVKTYYLILNLSTSKELWGLLGNIGHLAEYGQGAAYFLTGSLSYILYYLIALAFDILVFLSFIERTQAKGSPRNSVRAHTSARKEVNEPPSRNAQPLGR